MACAKDMGLRASALMKDFFLKTGEFTPAVTYSGSGTIHAASFEKIINICKSSFTSAEEAYTSILQGLQSESASIRYSAFEMCIKMFDESQFFREVVIKDLILLFELVAGTNPEIILPPPKSIAHDLRRLALATLRKWVSEYGNTYKELHVTYQFLKHCKRVDFDSLEMMDSADHARRLEREIRLNVFKEEEMKRLQEEIECNEEEIEAITIAFMNCITLLLSSPENFYAEEDCPKSHQAFSSLFISDAEDNESEDLTHVNLEGSKKIRIRRTEENSSIIDNANDNMKLINNLYMPLVRKWIYISVMYLDNNGFKKITDMKEKLEECVNKYRELNIEGVEIDYHVKNVFEEFVTDDYNSETDDSVPCKSDFSPVESFMNRIVKMNDTYDSVACKSDCSPTPVENVKMHDILPWLVKSSQEGKQPDLEKEENLFVAQSHGLKKITDLLLSFFTKSTIFIFYNCPIAIGETFTRLIQINKKQESAIVTKTETCDEELNTEKFLKMKKLIGLLVDSRENTLNKSKLREVTKICMSSPGYAEKAFSTLFFWLTLNLAESRYNAFQICIALFNESHDFRQEVVKNLPFIIDLVAERNPKDIFSRSASIAEDMKKLALATLQVWITQFGSMYKELDVAVEYLKLNEQSMESLKEEIHCRENEIKAIIIAFMNCITALLSAQDSYFIVDEKLDSPKPTAGDKKPEINLVTNKRIRFKRSKGNSDVLDKINDCVRLIRKQYMFLVKKWIYICIKHSENNYSNDVFKKVMSMKQKLKECIDTYYEFNIQNVENYTDG